MRAASHQEVERFFGGCSHNGGVSGLRKGASDVNQGLGIVVNDEDRFAANGIVGELRRNCGRINYCLFEGGNCKGKPGPKPLSLAFNPDAPAVSLHNPLAYCQSEAGVSSLPRRTSPARTF